MARWLHVSFLETLVGEPFPPQDTSTVPLHDKFLDLSRTPGTLVSPQDTSKDTYEEKEVVRGS